MATITPFLWFDTNAEEAATFYTGLFDDATVTDTFRMEHGSLLVISLRLQGQDLTFLNGGPHHKLSEAFSLLITCDSQDEVDRYWDALLEGGTPNQCGWLTDRFGVTWQVVPKRMNELLADPDREKAGRVMQAMMQMVKIDVAELEAAADGVPA